MRKKCTLNEKKVHGQYEKCARSIGKMSLLNWENERGYQGDSLAFLNSLRPLKIIIAPAKNIHCGHQNESQRTLRTKFLHRG